MISERCRACSRLPLEQHRIRWAQFKRDLIAIGIGPGVSVAVDRELPELEHQLCLQWYRWPSCQIGRQAPLALTIRILPAVVVADFLAAVAGLRDESGLGFAGGE